MMVTERLELHPLCALFPRMSDEQLNELAQDIAANGLRRCGVVCPRDILGSDFDDALREWGSSGVSRVRDLVMRNAVMAF